MEFILWKVKGYKGIHLTKDKLDSKKYSFEEIKKCNSDVIKQIENNLENDGIILALSKKKTIKAIYFFKLTKKDDEKVLIFDTKVVLDEVNKCIEEFENDIETVLDTILVNRHDIDRATWRKKEITSKNKIKTFIKNLKPIIELGMFVYIIMSLALIVCGTCYSFLGTSIYSIEEIKKDEEIINYISDINNYSYSETIEIISEYEDKVYFVVLEIIIPTIVTFFGYLLMILSLKSLLDLTKNVTDNNSLFTNEKNKLLKKMLSLACIALLIILRNFILWLLIVAILEVIEYMFNYCVQLTNKKINQTAL